MIITEIEEIITRIMPDSVIYNVSLANSKQISRLLSSVIIKMHLGFNRVEIYNRTTL